MMTEQNKLLDAVIRNAKRLQRLADDILDVTKIESQSLKLSNKQYFNLNDIIINVLAYYQKEENDNKKRKIKLLYIIIMRTFMWKQISQE